MPGGAFGIALEPMGTRWRIRTTRFRHHAGGEGPDGNPGDCGRVTVVWANDNHTIFSAGRRCRSGSLHTAHGGIGGCDTLVYEEPDERFEVAAFKTRSQDFLF